MKLTLLRGVLVHRAKKTFILTFGPVSQFKSGQTAGLAAVRPGVLLGRARSLDSPGQQPAAGTARIEPGSRGRSVALSRGELRPPGPAILKLL